MKLIRFGEAGKEKPGIVINNKRYSVADFFQNYNELFFEDNGVEKLGQFIKENPILTELDQAIRLGSPIARPSKIICIGLNYANHAKETNSKIPTEPIIFFKSTTSITGPFDEVMIPRDSVKTDWEVELAVVMGKKASYVEEAEAMDYVAGYCLHNDVSEREFQLERGGTWDKGKGCDTFAPLGPWMVTKDEIPDVHNLRIWLNLNGKKMQEGNTSDFIFNIPHVVAYISKFMTLLPGDIISTGTPAGVGLGFDPPVYLKPGDVIDLGIEGVGTARQKVVAFSKG